MVSPDYATSARFVIEFDEYCAVRGDYRLSGLRATTQSTRSGRAYFASAWDEYAESAVIQDISPRPRSSTVPELPQRESTSLVREIHRCMIVMVTFDNPNDVTNWLRDYSQEMFSYRREYVAGDDTCNIISLVMHGVDLDVAVHWLATEHAEQMERFLELWQEAEGFSFGSDCADRAFAMYLRHMMNSSRATQSWSFGSGRLFGRDTKRVKMVEIEELDKASRLASPACL
ncbi:hypothetical protein C8Q77DRAFT_1075180 [Trametes polyzona]|nr:hypothetical protein C8Q77DRAFT_1075180 [Trametes polyzona]